MQLVFALAWRNLWRNSRRTLLSASAIAFMVLLLIFSLSMQLGSYDVMVDRAAGPLHGHAQVQRPEYLDNPRMRYLLHDAEAVAERLRGAPGVTAVTTRALSSALASVGERTFGAMVLGVDPAHEASVSWLPGTVAAGRYLDGTVNEAVVGSVLARNLQVGIGDELVLLGVTPEDGMAVLVANVVGLLTTGQPEIDRTMVHVPLALFQEAFELQDSAHTVAVMYHDFTDVSGEIGGLRALLADDSEATVAPWQRLLPEIESAIRSDLASALVMYGLLVALITFSIANTFIMMIYERTREFGTLLAMGARPGTLVGTVQLETLMLCLLGAGVGAVLGVIITVLVGDMGISMGSGTEELMQQFSMPGRIHFGLAWQALLFAPLVMIVTTQAAAYFAGRKVRRMHIVEAVREEM